MAKVLACPNGCLCDTDAARIRCGQCGAELVYVSISAKPAADTVSESGQAPVETGPEAEDGSRLPRVPVRVAASVLIVLALAGFARPWEWVKPASAPRFAGDTTGAGSEEPAVRPPAPSGALPAASDEVLRPNDLGQSLERYQRALAERPSDPVLLDNVGQILVASGRPAEAVPYLERAVEAEPWSVTARFDLACAYSRTGRPGAAEEIYAELARSGSTDARVYHNLGLVLRQLNRNSDAVRAFEQATRLAPGEAQAWLGLGLSLEGEGRAEAAAEALDRYLALQPDGAEADSVRARRARLRPESAPAPQRPTLDDASLRRGP